MRISKRDIRNLKEGMRITCYFRDMKELRNAEATAYNTRKEMGLTADEMTVRRYSMNLSLEITRYGKSRKNAEQN